MEKQTAVEYLAERGISAETIEQAKQIEKDLFMELLAWVSVQDVNRINEHYVHEIVQMFYADKFIQNKNA